MRISRDLDIVLATATSIATTLDMRDVAAAVLSIGTVSTHSASTLQLWASSQADGTYRRLRNADGTAADLTIDPSSTEGNAYSLPVEVLGARYVKIVSPETNSTGVTGFVMFKS